MNQKYKAFVIREDDNKNYVRSIENKSISDLPEGDVLIKVKYSSLNYKDALSATGNKGVTKQYPHTPGIDASGVVVESIDDTFKPGDEVLVTGYDLGMNVSGGYQSYIRVPKSWVIPMPKGLSMKEAMIYGTAGFTAALSVYKLIEGGVKPSDGDILVTGATGGVGSVAVSILAKLGYNVYALTGKAHAKQTLIDLGAKDIILRDDFNAQKDRPLLRTRWAGVIDTVGGKILEKAIKATKYDGVVTCCGLVASPNLELTVFPFILRGVSLFGIDSVECKKNLRLKVWENIATDWKIKHLAYQEITLDELSNKIDLILKGQLVGRTIVKIDA